MYINDLPTVISKGTKINLYADDTIIFYSSENICDINDRLNADLRSISLWMEDNNLTLTAKKTRAMLLFPTQASPISRS